MLTKLEVQNVKGDILSLPLQDTSGGYEVRSIDGLDPVKATLVSSQMAQVDGAQPQSSRRETRNITMKIGITPNYGLNHTVASLRTALYNYLMPKALVTLYFYVDGALFATTTGTVESFANSMFSADPEVNISLICYDPDFYAPDPVTVSGNSVVDTSVQTIPYAGTSPVGVVFTMTLNTDLAGFQIYNSKPDGSNQIFDVEGTLKNGDIITITSIPRQKSIMMDRSGIDSSILFYVQPSSDWITLDNGDNDIRVYAGGAVIPFTIDYTSKYGAL